MDPEVEKLVLEFPELELLKGAKRVRCKLSGHEMPWNSKAILSYTSGNKFNKLKQNAEFPFDSYKPFIIPSETKQGKLFCALTGTYINKLPRQVEKHIKGRNYRYEKLLYEHGKKTLIREVEENVEEVKDEEDTESMEDNEGQEDDSNQEPDSDNSLPIIEPMTEDSPVLVKADVKRKRKQEDEEKVAMSSKKLKLLKKRRISITKGQKLHI